MGTILNLHLLVQTIQITILFVIGKILYHIPLLDHHIENFVASQAGMEPDLFRQRLFNWSMLRILIQGKRHDLMKIAEVGKQAPNTTIYDRNANKLNILDLLRRRGSGLLVLNFGSCT